MTGLAWHDYLQRSCEAIVDVRIVNLMSQCTILKSTVCGSFRSKLWTRILRNFVYKVKNALYFPRNFAIICIILQYMQIGLFKIRHSVSNFISYPRICLILLLWCLCDQYYSTYKTIYFAYTVQLFSMWNWLVWNSALIYRSSLPDTQAGFLRGRHLDNAWDEKTGKQPLKNTTC